MFNRIDIDKLINKIEDLDMSSLNSEFDSSFFVKNRVIPMEIGLNSIFCIAEEYDYNTVSNIEYLTKKKCNIEIVESNEFEFLLEKFVNTSILKSDSKNELNLFTTQSEDDSSNIETINYLNKLIETAIKKNVSDIHIEPFKDYIRVRFRIDGKLVSQKSININLHSIIITRIKILAKLDISERRLPQDGRITFQYENRDIDLRISTMPTIYGEKIALRILDSHFKFPDFYSLGLEGENLEIISNEIHKLNGLILVCGPTNSGKTTTIYSMLNQINDEGINITTLEDPVEYKIHGINQIQINYKTGLEFINTLNHILRQDPDVLSVGEMRNDETVKTALRAAITGHLVASTIHTNDSISAIFRLKDMHAESYLISSALKLVISQRLIRKLCPYCKEEYEEDSVLLEGVKRVFKPVGCIHCNGGFKDRIGVFEVLLIDSNIKNLINRNANYNEILNYARTNGFTTLKENLIKKVEDGITSIEEIIRII